MKRAPKIIVITITALTLAFIWGNSFLPKDISSEESNFVMRLISPLLEIFAGRGNVTEHMVRKIAHFTEFALLGGEMSIIFGIIWRKAFKNIWLCLPLIFANAAIIALIDETIQIFSGRGPAITDVWIDTCGAVSCSAIILLVIFLKERAEKNE